MATSFSAAAKAEVCRILPGKACCALSECFGILLFCNSFQQDSIKIITESREFGYILPKLFKRAFDLSFDSYPSLASPGKLVFQISDPEKIHRIMDAFGFAPEDTLSLHVNYAVVEEDCCKASFLRGAFLAGGSVTDPGKGYHMEVTTTHQSVSRETDALIREVMTFAPKTAKRGGGQVPLALEELAECIPDPDSMERRMDDRMLADVLNVFLSGLSQESRRIFLRRYWNLSSVKEIAMEYGISESKVKMSLMRTRGKLRRFLEQEGIAL